MEGFDKYRFLYNILFSRNFTILVSFYLWLRQLRCKEKLMRIVKFREKTVFVKSLPSYLGHCEKKSQLEEGVVYVREMYVSHHKNKFIRSGQMAPGRKPSVIDFQNEIVEMYVRREGEEEGRENRRGRHFIRWVFDKRLGANHTTAVMAKLRQNINQAFYIRYNYAYFLVNNETGLRMAFYKQQKGSPWINNFAEADWWVNEQENKRLNLDNIERPNTKWTFINNSQTLK